MCCLRLFLFLQATEEQFSASYPNVRTVAIKKVTIRYFFFIFLLLLVLLLSPRSPPSRLQISVNANLLPHSHKNFLIAVDIILTQYARWHHIAPHHTHTHTTRRGTASRYTLYITADVAKQMPFKREHLLSSELY
jgi:hypothetical protein